MEAPCPTASCSTRLRQCPLQYENRANGYLLPRRVRTPLLLPVIEAAPSNAIPRIPWKSRSIAVRDTSASFASASPVVSAVSVNPRNCSDYLKVSGWTIRTAKTTCSFTVISWDSSINRDQYPQLWTSWTILRSTMCDKVSNTSFWVSQLAQVYLLLSWVDDRQIHSTMEGSNLPHSLSNSLALPEFWDVHETKVRFWPKSVTSGCFRVRMSMLMSANHELTHQKLSWCSWHDFTFLRNGRRGLRHINTIILITNI